jgi:hypothetical protein
MGKGIRPFGKTEHQTLKTSVFSMREIEISSPFLQRTLAVAMFLLCIPSGAALLCKIYGIASMHDAALFSFLPASVALVFLYNLSKHIAPSVHAHVKLGFWGGLLGTVGYDLIRIPFHLTGLKVFFPISVYGIWLTDHAHSSVLTETVAWLYHFSNGITFGMMYGIVMHKRHWAWAMPWAFALETIAIVSPFSTIFGVIDNYYALGIAYLGHIAYALPLGWVMQRSTYFATGKLVQPIILLTLVIFFAIILILPRSDRKAETKLIVNERAGGKEVIPRIRRIQQKESLQIQNKTKDIVSIAYARVGSSVMINPGEEGSLFFHNTGIYQLKYTTPGYVYFSYVIVEPVERIHNP